MKYRKKYWPQILNTRIPAQSGIYDFIIVMHPICWNSDQFISSLGQNVVYRWLGPGLQREGRKIQAISNRNEFQRYQRADNEQGPTQIYLVPNIKEHVIGVGGGKGVALTIGSI